MAVLIEVGPPQVELVSRKGVPAGGPRTTAGGTRNEGRPLDQACRRVGVGGNGHALRRAYEGKARGGQLENAEDLLAALEERRHVPT